jgi:hypothetical protein
MELLDELLKLHYFLLVHTFATMLAASHSQFPRPAQNSSGLKNSVKSDFSQEFWHGLSLPILNDPAMLKLYTRLQVARSIA